MPDEQVAALGQLERELAYYRRECNDLGARLLRLQEEQGQAFREARRSRMVAKLIREAYRLADNGSAPEELGRPMLEVTAENAMCDGVALLCEEAGKEGHFQVTHALGPSVEIAAQRVNIPEPPAFFFTTSRTPIEPPAYVLTQILQLPYVLWAYDRPTGIALILGNRQESNVSRPFEAGDQELVEGALSVYIDVLLRKRAEVALRAAKEAAELARDERARFLTTLTHELRTPLNAVIGYAEMMAPGSRYTLSDTDRRAYAGQILDAGRHLLDLVDAVLDYASLEQVLPHLASAWQAVPDVLAAAAGIAGGAGYQRGVTVRVAPVDPALQILVDPVRFRQVLNNLLANAVKFSPDGEAVEVAAWREPEGGIVLSIRDFGPGMRTEDIPRALQPFQQIAGAAHGGVGLGLPIARGLVEAHGGALSIESAPGHGTTARISLPAGRVRQAPAAC